MLNLNVLDEDTPIDCIAQSLEKFTMLKIGHIEIKDSLKFLNASLDTLVNNLEDYADKNKLQNETFIDAKKRVFGNTYKYYEKYWSHLDEEAFNLLTRKGVYPYEYITSIDVLKEDKLPNIEDFNSELTGKGITEADFKHVKEMWKIFGMKTLEDLHNLYMETDVMLLADVFETFRENILKKYKLDPVHFMTAPSLTWTAGLKKTKVELQILTDPDMCMFVDQGLMGGISMISHPYAKNEDGFIFYCDANNLYGYAMSQYLPKDGFQWMDTKTHDWIKIFEDMKFEEDEGFGYFVEVDLEYPKELHSKHNNYPCAPEKMKVSIDELSPHQQQLREELKAGPATEKLCLTLHNKEKYILHHKNLLQYMKLGLKLKKVHRVLQFNQSRWLKEYIDMNTSFRQKALSKFEKDLFKLMNNAFFGKVIFF